MRHLVKIHKDYSEIELWKGVDIADIVVRDEDGRFADLLRERGYLSDDFSPSEVVTYYLDIRAPPKAAENVSL